MAKTNELGFTRMEMANVKRAFAANKGIYRKMETLEEKIKSLISQHDELENLSMTWEAPILELTNQRLGVKLSSKRLLEYCENPAKFFEDYPNNSASTEGTAVAVEACEEPESTEESQNDEENPFSV